MGRSRRRPPLSTHEPRAAQGLCPFRTEEESGYGPSSLRWKKTLQLHVGKTLFK
jgi:hypothetical protein